MKDNLLFVNHNTAIIQEFLDAMQDYTFEIDTADSGLEAAVLLRKKTYKVVITGMNLSTYDGTKLIAYLNQQFPRTVCIVYTRRVELAHLKLLINERDVFRIFLKPANYRGDFYNAIKDGFAYYDMKEAEWNRRKLLEQKAESAVVNLAEMEKVIEEKALEKEKLARFLVGMLPMLVKESGFKLSMEEKKWLLRYEKGIFAYYLKKEHRRWKELEEIKQDLSLLYDIPEENWEIDLEKKEYAKQLDQEFLEYLHFCIWLLLKRFSIMSVKSEVRIHLTFYSRIRARLTVHGRFSERVWQADDQNVLSRVITEITQSVLKNMAAGYARNMNKDQIVYHMELENKGDII